MKCPKCGQELRRSVKDPNYGLCDACKMKFKWNEFDEDDYEAGDAPVTPPRNGAPVRQNYNSAPEKKKGGCLKIALIVIAVIVVIGVIASIFGDKDDKVKDATNTKQNSDTTKKDKNKTTAKTEFAVGEVADYKNIQVSVLTYEESAGNDFGAPAEGNVFVFPNFEITNNSDTEISLSSILSFECYAGDYKLEYSSTALMAMSKDSKQQLDGSIAPGKKLNGYLGIEVPSDWTKIEIHYKDNVWLNSNFKFVITK